MLALLGVFCLVTLATMAEEKYTSRWDSLDVDNVLKNERLLRTYFRCVMDQGKCSPDAAEIKKNMREAMTSQCAKCTEKQRESVDKVMRFLYEKRQDMFSQLEKKYDPEGTSRKRFKDGADIETSGKETKVVSVMITPVAVIAESVNRVNVENTTDYEKPADIDNMTESVKTADGENTTESDNTQDEESTIIEPVKKTGEENTDGYDNAEGEENTTAYRAKDRENTTGSDNTTEEENINESDNTTQGGENTNESMKTVENKKEEENIT